MSATAQKIEPTEAKSVPTEPVECPNCGFKIYDGEVVRSRCFKIHTAEALCRCKKWVTVR